jgi:hypothetical protein
MAHMHSHNPPRTDLSMSSKFGILLVAMALAFGAFVYFVPSNAPTTAYNTPPVTTGQGTSRNMAPVIDQVKPAPAMPVPPAAAADDPAKQGVDAEEITLPPKP